MKRRDFERFRGQPLAIRGTATLAERARRLEGELLGVEDKEGVEYVRLRLQDQAVVDVPRKDIERAHLVFRWDEKA